MNVTLISPYSSIESFGLATLSSCLKKAGHNVNLCFLLNDFWDRYEDRVLDQLTKISSESQLIGISSH